MFVVPALTAASTCAATPRQFGRCLASNNLALLAFIPEALRRSTYRYAGTTILERSMSARFHQT